MPPDLMVVNAAIQALLADPKDGEAAQVIIEFGKDLPVSGPIQIEALFSSRSDSDVTGYTQEMGDFSVKDSQEHRREFTKGVTFRRVGNYRLWRYSTALICFQYFWGSALNTQGASERPDIFWLRHDRKTFAYQDLFKQIVLKSVYLLGLTVEVTGLESLISGKKRFLGFAARYVTWL